MPHCREECPYLRRATSRRCGIHAYRYERAYHDYLASAEHRHLATADRNTRAWNHAYRRMLRDLVPPSVFSCYPRRWPVSRKGGADERAYFRTVQRDALLNALLRPIGAGPPRLLPGWARAGAMLGPGPRCRFCFVLLRSVEWQLERCHTHWDVDIADCPATEQSLASFVSEHGI
jgi:hypothetical protein